MVIGGPYFFDSPAFNGIYSAKHVKTKDKQCPTERQNKKKTQKKTIFRFFYLWLPKKKNPPILSMQRQRLGGYAINSLPLPPPHVNLSRIFIGTNFEFNTSLSSCNCFFCSVIINMKSIVFHPHHSIY